MCLSLAVFAPFVVAMRFDYFGAPIHFEFLAATGLFVLCVYGILAFAGHSRRRRQIQIEDNTYKESHAADALPPSHAPHERIQQEIGKFSSCGCAEFRLL
jgi:hypothetical protein